MKSLTRKITWHRERAADFGKSGVDVDFESARGPQPSQQVAQFLL